MISAARRRWGSLPAHIMGTRKKATPLRASATQRVRGSRHAGGLRMCALVLLVAVAALSPAALADGLPGLLSPHARCEFLVLRVVNGPYVHEALDLLAEGHPCDHQVACTDDESCSKLTMAVAEAPARRPGRRGQLPCAGRARRWAPRQRAGALPQHALQGLAGHAAREGLQRHGGAGVGGGWTQASNPARLRPRDPCRRAGAHPDALRTGACVRWRTRARLSAGSAIDCRRSDEPARISCVSTRRRRCRIL